MQLQTETKELIQQLGSSKINHAAYDTAWVAQLSELGEPMGAQALDWLRENQLPDGSWGGDNVAYGHDRVICTLPAMIALARWGNNGDEKYLERARIGLDMALNSLSTDIAGATVGFEMLVPELLDSAYELGAIKRKGDLNPALSFPVADYYTLGKDGDGRRRSEILRDRLTLGKTRKIASLPKGLINRWVTVAFSAEMAGKNDNHLIDVDNLQEDNGSVACSPSATAYYASTVRPGDSNALDYLRDVAENSALANGGGIPEIAPFDIYEIGWSLWNLALSETLDKDMLDLCNPHLEFLMDAWTPGKGVGFATEYSPKDGDDTCLLYETLSRYGCEVDLDAVLSYEKDEHFRCYDLEVDSSVGVNIHVLGALRQAGLEKQHPSVQKVIQYIQKNKLFDSYWVDKWHISPYYVTAHAIIACAGYADEIVNNAVQWIISTQKHNGAWGFYLPTAEETAYCLQALFLWRRHGGTVPLDVLKRGVDWLSEHADPPYDVAFWICKCLYTPELIVRSAILSALMFGSEI